MIHRKMMDESLFARLLNPFSQRVVHLNKSTITYADVRKLKDDIEQIVVESDSTDPVILMIDTPGDAGEMGSRHAMEALRQMIENSRVEIWGMVTGQCRLASMYILQSCHLRVAVPEATLQFHDLRRVIVLDVFASDDPTVVGDMVAKIVECVKWDVIRERWTVAMFYQSRMRRISTIEILELMRDEAHLSAYQALSLGVIDRVEHIPSVVH